MKKQEESHWQPALERLLNEQIIARGMTDERLLHAFRAAPRHCFIPGSAPADAYGDFPLAIGEGQTISQPYMVALMVDALRLKGQEKVLEVGTGSGFQTAVLAHMAREVVTVERIPALAELARKNLAPFNFKNITLALADGTDGYSALAPYDAIIVSAAADAVPQALFDQMAHRGRMVMPVGERFQQTLYYFKRENGSCRRQALGGCVFVPLVAGMPVVGKVP